MKNAKKIKKVIGVTTIIFVAMILLTTITLGMYNKNGDYLNNNTISETQFFAIVEFTLYEGEGCGCDKLQDILIFADGLDTDHDVSGYTDDQGYCSLELEIDSTYRISIQNEDYQNVLFDFIVVDDQSFTFHLAKEEVSVIQDLIVSKTNIGGPELFSKEIN